MGARTNSQKQQVKEEEKKNIGGEEVPSDILDNKLENLANNAQNFLSAGIQCIKDLELANYKKTREAKACKLYDELLAVIEKHNPEPDTMSLVLLVIEDQLKKQLFRSLQLDG